MPSVPPAAMVPVPSPASTRARRSSGSAARPKVAVVATDDPQIAPKPVQAAITAIGIPPLNRPSLRSATRNMVAAMPDCSASAPIRMKRGMTDSV
ncbi:hypothetical protein D9M72_402300 [compost metagenome]